MSLLSNSTGYVDDSGAGHVRASGSMKNWSNILPNDTAVRIIYEGSGSAEEIVIIPTEDSASRSMESLSNGSFSIGSLGGEDNTVVLPQSSSSREGSSENEKEVVKTGSNPTTLLVVTTILSAITIATIFAVVRYSRRNRRQAYSENSGEAFIVGSLPHQAAPQHNILGAEIRPDLWVEGQYRYSPTMSGLENSLSGTAILSDNKTISAHNRLTVDAYPFGTSTRRGSRNNGPLNSIQRRHHENVFLDDISGRSRYRRGPSPVVLYEQESYEERKTNTSRRNYQQRRSSQRQRRHSPRQRHQRQRESQHQQRTSRKDMYASRREM